MDHLKKKISQTSLQVLKENGLSLRAHRNGKVAYVVIISQSYVKSNSSKHVPS